ncbi:MAG: mono/diheme cytochrome c family protein [Phenylobacterium sp.]|jgi:mono/diheme cytochrome c family protein
MLKTLKSWQILLLTLAFAVLGGLIGSGLLAYERQPASTPTMRGFYLAQEMGCFACHGPSGISGVSNYGALWQETPPFKAGGSIMSFIQSKQEIREWILYGLPRRLWPEDQKPVFSQHKPVNTQASGQKANWEHQQGVGGLIKMPAFEDVLVPQQVDDLVAYVSSIAELERPVDEQAKKGYKVASRLGCFGCHGANGLGGMSNPGSFKGYIPPWDGGDFAALVQNEDELKQWILEGKIDRFEQNPLAAYFTNGQIIQMPAFASVLKPGELEALMSYIYWLRDENRQLDRYWVDEEVPEFGGVVTRGEWLFHRSGCAACHGPAGIGGVPNANASGGFVPGLDDTAEKMELFEPQDVKAVTALFDRGLSLDDESIETDVEEFDMVVEQYQSIRDFILKGGAPGKARDSKGEPAMLMPAWQYRLYADGSPPAKADIDAIIAYLLSLQQFDEDEDE